MTRRRASCGAPSHPAAWAWAMGGLPGTRGGGGRGERAGGRECTPALPKTTSTPTHTYSRPVRPFSLPLPFPRGLETVWLQPSRLCLSVCLPLFSGSPVFLVACMRAPNIFEGFTSPGGRTDHLWFCALPARWESRAVTQADGQALLSCSVLGDECARRRQRGPSPSWRWRGFVVLPCHRPYV